MKAADDTLPAPPTDRRPLGVALAAAGDEAMGDEDAAFAFGHLGRRGGGEAGHGGVVGVDVLGPGALAHDRRLRVRQAEDVDGAVGVLEDHMVGALAEAAEDVATGPGEQPRAEIQALGAVVVPGDHDHGMFRPSASSPITSSSRLTAAGGGTARS